MPSISKFIVAAAWMYGWTTEQAKNQYLAYENEGEKQIMFRIIRAWEENAWKAYARN